VDSELESMLDRADELIGNLKDEYQKCLNSQTVTNRAQNITHEVLEKLRHALDHAMWRAWNKYVSPNLSENSRNSARVYFPIADDLRNFRSTLGRGAMKDLDKVQKDFYDFVLSKQPFSSNENKWLDLLTKISAEGKHVKLAPQKGIEVPPRKVPKHEVSSISSDPFSIKFNAGEEKWVSFVLDDYGLNALGLCIEMRHKIHELIEEMDTI
jgi:hypothetical protein